MTFVGAVLWWMVLGALLGWVAAWWLGRSSQRLLTEPEVRLVERRVDNPQHVARIATLEGELGPLRAEAALIPGLQARIDEMQAAPPRVVEKVVTRTVDRVVEKPVERIVEKIVEKPVDRIVEKLVDRVVEKVVDRPVPDVAAIAARDAALAMQRHRVEHLQALAEVLAARIADGRQAGATPSPAPAAAQAGSPSPVAARSAASPSDTDTRPLRARIEHLTALAEVQAERLADARRAAGADGR